jgi:hypothetical protein
MPRRLGHDETLRWVREHHAWRLASKTKPIWGRPVEATEVGHIFATADYAEAVARPGSWLSVGACGEPWFQTVEAVESKYERRGTDERRFAFDDRPRSYVELVPRTQSRNWAACVEGRDIEGFYIKVGHDRDSPLYSPAGGYVVRDPAEDPYAGEPHDVWLVQRALFESTYDWV